ncbi:MAG: hypothetical protein HYZ17_16480 [Betaproteobacteria bacterium]|nr:hypothetical protein [Betaproteobacteria bacterium]
MLCMVRPSVYSHWCEGCQACHSFNVHELSRDGHVLGFDGDLDRPSIGEPVRHEQQDGRLCEYLLRGGVLYYLESCSHALAGQSRALIDCPH